MRIGIAASIAALVVAFGSIAAPATATVPDDPLGCTADVYDPSGVADSALTDAAHLVADSTGADVHVRIEQTVDGDIDARELQLESQCPTWRDDTGDRAFELLVVMVSPDERQTLIAFGEEFFEDLDTAGPQIQEFVMNPQFKLGNVQQGLIDGLQTISSVVEGGSVPGVQEPLYDGTDFTVPYSDSGNDYTTASSSSNDTPTGAIVFFVVILIIIVVASVVAKQKGWDTGTSSGTSRYRRSSYRSSSRSFSSSRSSGGGSRRSSGSSSHRGGGSSSSSW